MSKDDKGTDSAEALGSVLNRVLSPLMDRLERLEARSAAANPPAAPPASADEQMAKLMAAMRGQQEGLEEFGLVEVVEGCTSDVSGATFDAEVQYPVIKHMGKIVGKGPKGIVKVMRNYAWPAGIDKHVAEGGVVPDGMTMNELGPGGQQETDAFRQWKYETFAKADNQRFVGKPLPAHVRPPTPVAPAVSAG